jgi:hypothetical protein
MSSDFRPSINGTRIKTPSDFKISRYNITKSGRVASGNMQMEFISKKIKLFLTYDAITGIDFNTILSLIDTNNMFFSVTYYDTQDTATTKICYVGEISQTLMRRGYVSDSSVWKDITFDLIQQ